MEVFNRQESKHDRRARRRRETIEHAKNYLTDERAEPPTIAERRRMAADEHLLVAAMIDSGTNMGVSFAMQRMKELLNDVRLLQQAKQMTVGDVAMNAVGLLDLQTAASIQDQDLEPTSTVQ